MTDLEHENEELRERVASLEAKLTCERIARDGLNRSLALARDTIALYELGEEMEAEPLGSPFAERRCLRVRRCDRCGTLRCVQRGCVHARGRV